MKMISYNKKTESLNNSIEWLSKLTDVPLSSRFPKYQKIWNEIVELSDLPNGGVSQKQMLKIIDTYGEDEVRGAILETDEIVEIHNTFSNSTNSIPPLILNKIIKGRFSETQEESAKSDSLEPRNILFELTLAAKFQSAGFQVKFNDNDADLTFNFRTYKVFIECKRFFNEKNFESNFRKANEQLLKRYQIHRLPKNSMGIVPIGLTCFSLTKVINRKQLFLKANSSFDAKLKIDETIDKIVLKKSELIKRKTHANTIGILFYARVPVILPTGIGAMSRWKIFPLQLNVPKLNKICEDIFLKLKNKVD